MSFIARLSEAEIFGNQRQLKAALDRRGPRDSYTQASVCPPTWRQYLLQRGPLWLPLESACLRLNWNDRPLFIGHAAGLRLCAVRQLMDPR